MSELLFACPFCDQAGFTARGLHAHRCRQLPKRRKLDPDFVKVQIAMQTAEAKKRGTLFKKERPA